MFWRLNVVIVAFLINIDKKTYDANLVAVFEGDLVHRAIAVRIVRLAALALEIDPPVLVSCQRCQKASQL